MLDQCIGPMSYNVGPVRTSWCQCILVGTGRHLIIYINTNLVLILVQGQINTYCLYQSIWTNFINVAYFYYSLLYQLHASSCCSSFFTIHSYTQQLRHTCPFVLKQVIWLPKCGVITTVESISSNLIVWMFELERASLLKRKIK